MSEKREQGMRTGGERLEELETLAGRIVDDSGGPGLSAEEWQAAVQGVSGHGVSARGKKAVSLRLDADVIAWLKKDGPGYQTRANQILRDRMLKELDGR